ncbi:DegT/DnrJ/EryC1/StrS family aminotransferase [Shouchella clausii]|uniref:DegT/DnrJ/EryC1/StrS family aminotransferase n=1 Tax=Shouchella clausii TaxID=79880 RepID=UPI000BA681D7|nr:aminotransferase class I/II-fold pyridoxal phosphate-dependent enzyme [Shouchella clausii]MBX0319599.1 aminotransferase class I/II-fold pyridoxal phosphate-dependent enzyme [Shouchella clausii]MCZ1182580.1 aminotransferase class I/II-fold pyridoxal phosphate-dependent enzyme [Shouchella clausii]MDO7283904.1 aminotransferase class I/II-fold pyridoxal phosphate-dependent enzyme [Shouchella clausii]MDO7304000.1 aminotransferase class I/II-fold pyridoxal phosphate-dependent enzyme [Shouchella cl
MSKLNNTDRIFLSPPHLGDYEKKFVNEAFSTNWIAPLGPNVDLFEKELSQYVGNKYATATSSGTAAIHLALNLCNVNPGDVVFCSTLTFIASANPILYSGAKPVFIDSDIDTWNMSPVALKKAFKYYASQGIIPKAVIVVNLYGQSADYTPILEVCNEYNVPVIEDAAESLGSTYKGKKSGTFGKYGIFSFNGNKIITTSGGGMLISNDKDGIERAKFLATQAKEPEIHYEHKTIGYNYRLSNVLAGIGRGQLKVLESRIQKRKEIFRRYEKELGEITGFNFMPEANFGRHNRWLTTLIVDPSKVGINSTEIVRKLNEYNIESRPVWKPLHKQPIFTGCLYFTSDNNSVSEYLFKNGICLPSGSNLTYDQQSKVINSIKEIVSKVRS